MDAALASAAAIADQRQKIEQYRNILATVLSSSPPDISQAKRFLDHMVSDEVPLVVSRQLLQTFAQDLGKLESDTQKEVAHYALTQIQPRLFSLEEQERRDLIMRGRDTPAAAKEPRSRRHFGLARAAATLDTGSSQSESDKKRAHFLMEKCNILQKIVKATDEKFEAKMLLAMRNEKIKHMKYVLEEENNESKKLKVQKPRRLNTSSAIELKAEAEKQDMAIARKVEEINRMRNQIQDLRGNIRVFARLYPLKGKVESIFSKVEDDGRTIKLLSKNKSYKFDKIFDADVKQADLFEHMKGLVERALVDCKVCIMAYGQSGSGKTFTMIGKNDVNDDRDSGLVPRTGKFILENMTPHQILKLSIYEVYNDNARDLLNRSDGKYLKILRDDNDLPIIVGLTAITITSVKELSSILEQAVSSRSTAETKLNKTSSQSHCIFQYCIFDATDKDLGGVTLIDLAGAESAEMAGAVGTTQREESKNIGTSLHFLQLVLRQIADKEAHISFRDTTLTKILEPYMKCGARVSLIATASQQESEMRQSENTLDFAMKVKCCALSEVFNPRW